MLRELHIKNVAVIDEANVSFDRGFHVLTGETGAGKSILIDSINMALGSRTNKDLVRSGTEYALVDALFEVSDKAVLCALAELDIETEEGELIISRKLTAEGKSTCRLNGRVTPLSVVKEVGALLINIHGQHDNQALLNPKAHIGFVDKYGDLEKELEDYRTAHRRVSELRKRLNSLTENEQEKAHRLDLLSFQINEIDSAKLSAGEEEELEQRREYLSNIEKITTGLHRAYGSLYEGADEQSAAFDLISYAVRQLSDIAEFNDDIARQYETLNSVLADLEDVTRDMRGSIEDTGFEPGELDFVESRLNTIYDLKRKYGSTVAEVLEYREKIGEELNQIEHSDELTQQITAELAQAKKAESMAGEILTKKRNAAAAELQERIMGELADLDMAKVRFEVRITPLTDADGAVCYGSNGGDDVEFLISSNPGEPLKSLTKIASGGEMSRVMLAMKSVLADADPVETLIFDEIDTGVSGRAAQKIAEKIHKLARDCQVLCITHLAQIAGMADGHYLIQKNMDESSTATTVKKLEPQQRKEELARIIGGVKVTELTLRNAQEMLDLAESLKNK